VKLLENSLRICRS